MLQDWAQLWYPCAKCHMWISAKAMLCVGSLLLVYGPASKHLRQPMACWAQAQLELHLPAKGLCSGSASAQGMGRAGALAG